MANVRKMTDGLLSTRRMKADKAGDQSGGAAIVGIFIGAAGYFLGIGLIAGAGLCLAAAATAKHTYACTIWLACHREIARREKNKSASLPVQPGGDLKSILKGEWPSAAEEFNPAAATVLEKDMRPMAPLRLQLRKYIHG